MEEFAKALASLQFGWILLGYAVILAILFVIFRKIEKTKPYVGQLMVLSAVCLMALLFFILTFSFKTSKMATGATARSMPQTWCIALIPVALLCLKSILDGSSKPDEPFGRWKLVVIVAVAIFASVFLFQYIGYYLSSAIFLLLLMWLMEERRPVVLAAVPIGWCVFTYFVFAKFLFISLPVGSLFSGLF